MKGQDIFLRRSELGNGMKGIIALMLVFAVVTLSSIFFPVFDGWFVGSTLVSQAIIMGLGLTLVSGMILQCSSFKTR